MKNRVVITGLGVVAPNGIGISNFKDAIMQGISGIKYIQELKDLTLSCHVAGVPMLNIEYIQSILPQYLVHRIETTNLLFGMLAGVEAWQNAGLKINTENVDWDSGVIMGMQTIDGNFAKSIMQKVYNENIRKLSGRTAEQAITSSLTAYLSGFIGLGNCSIANSSACATGTESIYMGYRKIKNGEANRILVGSSESNSPFIWAALDKLKVLNNTSNEFPEKASKPMSKDAKGLIPACGAGALVLENLDTALNRNAKIYAEIIGGHNNCGGQRNGGTMTNPNPEGMIKCIQSAIKEANISTSDIDLISGHLTATYADPIEINVWATVLNLPKVNFPYINSLKSMIGHCLAAAGSIESVAAVIQLHNNFVHPSLNCEQIHPNILEYLTPISIPNNVVHKELSYIAKASFGFGDLNTCLIFKKYTNE